MTEALKDYTEMDDENFRVTDDRMAEWCLKKLREAEEDKLRWKRHYEAQLEKVNRVADDTIAYMTEKLEQYFDTLPHKVAKTQESYTLPSAKLVRKRQQPAYTTDDDVLVHWLEETFPGQLVKIKKTADWVNLKKLVMIAPDGAHVVTEDGEIVPGVMVTPRPDIFKVESVGDDHV